MCCRYIQALERCLTRTAAEVKPDMSMSISIKYSWKRRAADTCRPFCRYVSLQGWGDGLITLKVCHDFFHTQMLVGTIWLSASPILAASAECQLSIPLLDVSGRQTPVHCFNLQSRLVINPQLPSRCIANFGDIFLCYSGTRHAKGVSGKCKKWTPGSKR